MWIMLKNQSILIWVIVIVIAIGTAIRVILDTRSPTKTAAYLLLIMLLPVGGSLLYFLVGVNYRKRKIYSKKLTKNETLFKKVQDKILKDSQALREKHRKLTEKNTDLISLLLRESYSSLTENKVSLLTNGDQKFEKLLEAIEEAKKFIHMEYYIFDSDRIGTQIKDALIRKANEGVIVRIIFDDFGSHGLWDSFVDEFRENGVQIFPFFRVHFMLFANRINYRDHRKVVIIDGIVGFVGGINIADRYQNLDQNEPYWRDSHIRIEGGAVLNLQYHFLSNWNFCSDENLGMEPELFPEYCWSPDHQDLVQIVTGGPDYPRPSIMLSYFTAIMEARNSVYITSPYFIPNESITNAIRKAAFSGKDIRILLPEKSDSALVDAASRFYFQDLLEAGVKIYLHHKGFIHAKTMVTDNTLSIVGTANMDMRSFDLNFEINAVVYSERINSELTSIFLKDLENSRLITLEEWKERNRAKVFVEALARITAPLL